MDLRQQSIGFGMGERQGQRAWIFRANGLLIDMHWHHRKRFCQLIGGQHDFWAYGCVIAFLVSLRLQSVSL